MYVIVAYDVGEERVQKVGKLLKTYLPRVQNSVFEGELSVGKLERLKARIRKLIEPTTDAVLLWVMQDDRRVDRQVVGLEKLPVETLL